MINYGYNYSGNVSIVINKNGFIIIENQHNNDVKLEIDYNCFDENIINEIKKDNEEEFEKITNCKTLFSNNSIKNCIIIPFIEDEEKKWLEIISENNSINFSFIYYNFEIIRNNNVIMSKYGSFSKKINFNISDGEYIFKFEIFDLHGNKISENFINVVIISNNFDISNGSNEDIYVNLTNNDDFKIKLSANSKKLYSFEIDDIITTDNKIIDFSFYNTDTNDKLQRGKIGSVFSLLNNKEIEELEKYPELDNNINKKFVFDIQELLSEKSNYNDIGVIRLPTLRSKFKDNFNYYYDLKCYIEDVKNINIPKENNILITDKFKQTPLFYKFIINKKIDDIYIYDENNKEIDNYIIEQISDSINIVYFQPVRNILYFYKINGEDTIYNIDYKDNKLPFSMKINKNYYNENKPIFLSDIILKSEEKELEFEIVFEDHEVKNIILTSTSGECVYLENERVKINKKVIGIKCLSENNFELINMIGNVKNNRTDLIFLKSNTTDFVYYAKEFKTVDLNSIPDDEIAKMKIGKKYIFENSKISEVNNGPLELEDIKLSEIVFTDIDEYKTEGGVAVTDSYSTLNNDNLDEFFNKNVKEVSMEVINENY